ncbi:MAG: biotin--[acetyl-CoA-carboxylase] ligase [Gammaproteobacteria bacterium]|nr:biotin--[acetyl-CoA-carboxylase] ligase [Gammaproteobacteria bacterium]
MRLVKQTVELLDSDKIKAAMTPGSLSKLHTLSVFDTIGSTNSYLMDCAKSGVLSGSVCIADQQTRGRGRQGRTWYSPPGANIYCSLLWYFPVQQTDLAALSLAVAVMVAKCLTKYGITNGIQLKWPNDVLFQSQKLAGILLERLPENAEQIGIVVGVGLNLMLPQENVESAQWIDVASIAHRPLQRNYLAGLLINEILHGLSVYQQQGFRAFINEWQQLDVMRGKEVTVHRVLETVTGTMEGINEKGELLLKSSDNTLRTFHCGEVSVRYLK